MSDYDQQVSFDSAVSEFNISSGEENLRQIGFELSNSDVGSGIFNNKYLHNYSFFQDITVSGVPDYYIDLNMRLEIVPLYYQDTTFTYLWEMEIKNNYSCNHTLRYTKQGTTIHAVNCDYCNYSYYESHENSYVNLNEQGHMAQCNYCNYSSTEEHSIETTSNTQFCLKCDYSEELVVIYISNGDGKTHTKKSIAGSKIENCISLNGGTGVLKCAKCGQEMDKGLGGGLIMSVSKDNSKILADKIKTSSFKKKENDINDLN